MTRDPKYSLNDDSRFRSNRLKESTQHRWEAKTAGFAKLVIGLKDDLEQYYGAELEGPYGLIWFSKDGRMVVWSYDTYGRAKIAALNMQRGSFFDAPRIEFL